MYCRNFTAVILEKLRFRRFLKSVLVFLEVGNVRLEITCSQIHLLHKCQLVILPYLSIAGFLLDLHTDKRVRMSILTH